MATKPSLGLVPYLPSHNHGMAVPCQEGCPVLEWELHVERRGNPYDEIGRLREALTEAHRQLERFEYKGPKQLGRAMLTIERALNADLSAPSPSA